MVKYSFEAVSTLLASIPKINGRPNFSSLWHLSQSLNNALRGMEHPDYTDHGWTGYMLTVEEYALISTTPFVPPTDVGNMYVMPNTAITDRDQQAAKAQWDYYKEIHDSFKNIKTALKKMFERVIDSSFHTSGNAALMSTGFGTMTPPEIMARLRRLYGKATIQELERQLLILQQPMDRNNPVEMMLRGIEEVQMFLLADAEENQEMTEVQLIKYGLIKLSKTGGLYAKAIEHWNARDPKDRRAWVDFKTHMIEEYEKLLRESGGTTMGQEGYGAAYNATEETEDSSLAESIVKYAERATSAERTVADLEGRLAVLEMGTTMAPPPQAAYFMPQQPTFTFPPQQPPANINIPQQQMWAPAAGGKRRTEGNAYRGKKPRQSGRGGRGGNSYNNDTNMRNQPAYSNKHKMHLNKFYCYSCGYDVDHDGYNCPINHQKQNHLPHITRDNAHLVEGASMKAQHKTLPDGTGAGQGWVLERNLGKARFTMQKREEWMQQQQGGAPKWTSTWSNNERPVQPPNPQWRAQAPAPAQQQANHAYQMQAYGPPTQYPPQWSQQQGPPHYPSGPPPNQGAPWGPGYP
jgi:hypothetical protein